MKTSALEEGSCHGAEWDRGSLSVMGILSQHRDLTARVHLIVPRQGTGQPGRQQVITLVLGVRILPGNGDKLSSHQDISQKMGFRKLGSDTFQNGGRSLGMVW